MNEYKWLIRETLLFMGKYIKKIKFLSIHDCCQKKSDNLLYLSVDNFVKRSFFGEINVTKQVGLTIHSNTTLSWMAKALILREDQK
ncbi:MAG: hypothetical protein H0X31_21730 [Nostocaceae cyanobacterium]|nr:hypothetical protein [Nostocaceae cyanobacterium]